MTRYPLTRIAVTVVIALAAAAPPASASSAGPAVSVAVDRASGAPSTYFSQTARPNTERRAGSLIVRNDSARTVTVRLRPVNALTTDTLGSAYGAVGAQPRRSTTWLSLGEPSFRLAAGERRRVPVAVRVPAGTAAGDYLAGISVATPGQSRATSTRNGLMINEEYRYAVGVETRIPGARTPRIEMPSAKLVRQPSTAAVLVRARNTGNVTLKRVRGSVLVTSGDRVVARQPIGPGTFVAGTAIRVPVRLDGERPRGGDAYRVRARMVYGPRVATLDTVVRFPAAAARVQEQYEAPAERATGTRGVTPWLLAAAGGILAALVLLLVWRRRHVPGPRATGRALDRELAALRGGGRPLSVVQVASVSGRREQRAVARAVRPLLPSAHRIGRLDDERLLIMLPRAGAPLVAALNDEIRDALADLAPDSVVASTTVTQSTTRDVVLARLEPAVVPDAVEMPAYRHAA